MTCTAILPVFPTKGLTWHFYNMLACWQPRFHFQESIITKLPTFTIKDSFVLKTIMKIQKQTMPALAFILLFFNAKMISYRMISQFIWASIINSHCDFSRIKLVRYYSPHKIDCFASLKLRIILNFGKLLNSCFANKENNHHFSIVQTCLLEKWTSGYWYLHKQSCFCNTGNNIFISQTG